MLIMHNPPHPGEILKEEFLIPLNLSITKFAKKLDVSRQTLSDLLSKKRSVSIEMAFKLSKALNTTPEMWLNMQLHYNIANMKDKIDLSKVEEILKVG